MVITLGALEEASLDERPEAADDRDETNQDPPAGLVAVMPSLDAERKTDPDGGEVHDPEQQPDDGRVQDRGANGKDRYPTSNHSDPEPELPPIDASIEVE